MPFIYPNTVLETLAQIPGWFFADPGEAPGLRRRRFGYRGWPARSISRFANSSAAILPASHLFIARAP